jgi:hypothetical protein
MLRNAEDLIKDYWDREKQKKKAIPKSQSASAPVKRGRKSEVITIQDDDEKPAKKRVRKSQGPSEDEEEEERRKKTSKKSSEKNASKAPVVPDEDVEEIDEEAITDITGNNKYMKMPSWEEIVQRIETVEFDKQLGYLVVYMLLK